MESIGRHYQQLFPTALPNTYSQGRFLFRHANTQRSRASISAFADGLFGSNRWTDVVFEPIPEQDVLLHPINFCPSFWEQVSVQPDFDAFAEGTEIENMLDEINSRLGFRGANQLDLGKVLLMWEWCRFETGSSSGTGAWCVPFTVHHHSVLEYYRDLHYYYFTGYGVPDQRLIQNLNCNLMHDLLTLMQSNNPNDRTVRLYSSFSQIVQAFLVTLGAFNDGIPLTHHNFAQQSSRSWRTSFLTPNAAHLVVVRYEWDDWLNYVHILTLIVDVFSQLRWWRSRPSVFVEWKAISRSWLSSKRCLQAKLYSWTLQTIYGNQLR